MKVTEQQILHCLMQARTRLSGAAWLVVRDTHAAEDIFQNVALKAMTGRGTFESEAALLSWAFITARREGIDWLRRHQREIPCLDADILDMLEQEWQSATPHSTSARIDALQDCLAAAPESARQLLKLRYDDGHSCDEVAEQMGVGLNALYKRISRLHESLKDCIEGKLSNATTLGGTTL